MLDERLLPEENDVLLSEDVYDIHDIFETDTEATAHIAEQLDLSIEEVTTMWEQYDEDDHLIATLAEPGNTLLQYYWFATGRVALVEFY